MSWQLYYAHPDGTGEQSVALESLGALDGGQVTGDGIKFSFRSHAASEVMIRIPAIDPATVPVLPFMSRVRLVDGSGTQQFVGRRINWDGVASPDSSGTTYQFQDAWWDLSKITFKSTWWNGAYTPVSVTGTTVTFSGGATFVFQGTFPTVTFYDATKTAIGRQFNVTGTITNPTTHFSIDPASGSGTYVGAAFVSFQNYFTDVVLFQYNPNDAYQSSADVTNYYITTGAQIREILNFAIALGVPLQVGEIDPALYVPWYPMRCPNCAEAIKVCLRDHPDCFTEIDYTTTPPTFNVRRRTSLTPVTLPYAYTDANGVQHEQTSIRPRPDLVPTRIGIFYRYLVNGTLVALPTDIYPANAPDGILALDYSIDIQGPRIDPSFGQLTSRALPTVPCNPADPNDYYLAKFRQFYNNTALNPATGDIDALAQCDATGNTANPVTIVKDASGNIVDTTVFAWEMIGGGQVLWMTSTASGPVTCTPATIQTWFSYVKKHVNTDGTIHATLNDEKVAAHLVSVNVNLVNTASIQQTYYAYLTSGEAIPANLAQNIYNSLQALQYELHQDFKVEPLVSFIKPGAHAVNLAGGNADWTTMAATVQESNYTIHQRPDGVVWAKASVSCGPVEHLEAGQLVQLFNIFANRDLAKIDPWERITGTSSAGGNGGAVDNTAKENSVNGVPVRYQTGVGATNVP